MDLPEYVWNRLVFKASTQFMGAIPEVAANGKHDANVENIGSHQFFRVTKIRIILIQTKILTVNQIQKLSNEGRPEPIFCFKDSC